MAYELEERLVKNVQTKEQKVNIKKYRKYREFKSYMHTLKRLVYVQLENHMESEKWQGRNNNWRNNDHEFPQTETIHEAEFQSRWQVRKHYGCFLF